MTEERWLRFLLRLNGVLAVMAAVAVVMPHSWLVWCVGKAEPGLPVLPLVSFLARLLSGFYVLLGILLLIFATDVRRYARPIQLTMIWCWLLGGALLSVAVPDAAVLLARRFFRLYLSDMIYGLIMSVAIVLLLRRVMASTPASGNGRLKPTIAEPGAARNGGPAAPVDNSGVREEPPSVS
jgi:hypothetical protein